MTQVVTILSGQSVISRVYTSHFGNGTARLEPQVRWYWKKYQVLYKVENLQKWAVPNRAMPYHTVEKHHNILLSVIHVNQTTNERKSLTALD